MANKRRKLLETSKSAGKSIAGTLGSVAGTISSKTGLLKDRSKQAAAQARAGVVDEYNKLTDETVTDQDRARLQRAQREARQEAAQEARREFREEFRENIFDEAYDAELQELRQKFPEPGVNTQSSELGRKVSRTQQRARNFDPPDTQQRTTAADATMAIFSGGGAFGASQPQQQANPFQFDSPIEQQQGSPLGIFGQPNDPRDTDPAFYDHDGVETLFGVNSGGKDKRRQVDPLFGFRF